MTKLTRSEILTKIEGLQQTRKYADEVERTRLTAIIAKLFEKHEKAPREKNGWQ